MPSLRRTFSSPSVRSSPYPSSLSSSQAGARAHGHGHRRSSGSETSSRRVLADIEWWRVSGGQQEQESDDRVDRALGDVTGNGIEIPATPEQESSVERPTTPSLWATSTLGEAGHVLPIPSFAALGVAPQTPPRRGRASEGSTSSVESSPESVGPSLEGLRRGFADLSLEYPDPTAKNLLPRFQRRAPIPPVRSLSLGDASFFNEPIGQYADFSVSPLSSSALDFLN
ncbi:hypothetical protein EYR40_000941 [Pleurotus pulmonarius]|nr:hypothetical protein EYR36_004671 [Pleurotus pulmonarius]KAF4578904.1 hypothetical protein EYR36_000712 [Pleurotus pulmonarius]KAF4603769.1 hypothetical protein EYR38_004185 [Pleurotus pulmonarius]KAF4608595.1 hypothetical protein EYR40_000941 [Pleurotus pulmonarius]